MDTTTIPPHWSDVIRQAGQRVTPQRQALFSALTHTPQTVQELLANPRVLASKLDQTTAYRTLDAWVELGLVSKTHLGSRGAVYELLQSHHHHVVCQSCGIVRDVKIAEQQLIGAAASQTDFTITNHVVEFFGVCQNCREN